MNRKNRTVAQKREDAPNRSEQNEKLLSAIRDAEIRHLDRALAELRRLDMNTDEVRNAKGVCLLRLGQYQAAIQLFRPLVLAPGCTWMKLDLPVIYRTNFCTALLLGGHPAGCLNCLSDIAEQNHPSVVRLRQALSQWEKKLSWWPWLLWKLGVEADMAVELDFQPGEFIDPTEERSSVPPDQSVVLQLRDQIGEPGPSNAKAPGQGLGI